MRAAQSKKKTHLATRFREFFLCPTKRTCVPFRRYCAAERMQRQERRLADDITRLEAENAVMESQLRVHAREDFRKCDAP